MLRVPSLPRGRDRVSLRIGVAFAACLVATATAQAGANVWTTNGPSTAGASSVVTDLSTPGALYAGAPGGVYKSTDDGATWLATALFGQGATVSATAPPATVYAVSGDLTLSTLFVSRNGGATWSALVQSAFNGFGLVVDPFVTSTLYTIRNTITPRPLSGQGSLLRSTDGGATWVPFQVGSGPDSPLLTALVADRATAGRLYAATSDTAAFSP